MPSKKTLEIQKKKHVESKREWLWISTKLNPKTGKKTKGITYISNVSQYNPNHKEA